MSNVIGITNNTSNLNTAIEASRKSYAGEEAYFPVTTRRIESVDGLPISSHKSVVRTDTNKVIAIVGEGHKIVSNEEVFGAFERAIGASQIKTDGMRKIVDMAEDGARTAVRYQFPEHMLEVSDGDSQILEIVALNSYNGSWAFRSMVGAYRMICCNGMVVGTDYAQSYGRHTKNLDIHAAADKLKKALESYEENVDLWKTYPRIALSDAQVKNIIKGVNDSEKVQEKIYAQYVSEANKLGKNMWALFNTLTFWSTHMHSTRAVNSGNIITGVISKEESVRKAVNSKAWKELELIAA